MSDNGSSGWEFAAGFFIGGVVGGLLGAAAALLMAPQAGEDTRTLLREKGIELRERAADLSGEARQRIDEAAVEARRKAEEATAGIRESARLALDDSVAQVKDAYESGKQAGETKMEELRKSVRNTSSTSPAEPI